MDYDLPYFRGRLKIDRHALDTELEVHADHADRIGREVSRLTRAEAFAKRALAQVEAEEVRRITEGSVKVSQAAAASQAILTRAYQTAWSTHQDALDALRQWESLAKSWYQRGFDLKALGDLFGHQYFRVDTLYGPADVARTRQEQREAVGDYAARMSRRSERRVAADEPEKPIGRTVLKNE